MQMAPTPEAELAKAVMENGPLTMKNLIPTLFMAGIAMVGGYVNFRQKMQAGSTRAWNITELLGEMFVSGMVGIVTFWVFRGFEVNEWLTAAGVAISGHLGSRGIFMIEKSIEKKFDTWAGK